MGKNRSGRGASKGDPIASRLKTLIAGLKQVFGEEETMQMMSNPMTCEEISAAAKRHSIDEITAALADAKARNAERWSWVAQRLRNPR